MTDGHLAQAIAALNMARETLSNQQIRLRLAIEDLENAHMNVIGSGEYSDEIAGLLYQALGNVEGVAGVSVMSTKEALEQVGAVVSGALAQVRAESAHVAGVIESIEGMIGRLGQSGG